jgi:hypothetical protein
MSSCRALVNHSLYCARVLLEAWQRDRMAEQIASKVLEDSYQPGLKYHLGRAYGYLLLEALGSNEAPQKAPERLRDLPSPAPGKSLPLVVVAMARGETGELSPVFADLTLPNSAGSAINLAVSTTTPNHAQWMSCYQYLQTKTSEIRDVLDEC